MARSSDKDKHIEHLNETYFKGAIVDEIGKKGRGLIFNMEILRTIGLVFLHSCGVFLNMFLCVF